MTTPSRSIEDIIVDVVKLINPERKAAIEDIRKVTAHFDFYKVVDTILPLDDDATDDYIDSFVSTFPEDVDREHLTGCIMALLLTKKALVEDAE